jgi:hypothetical protein
LAETETVAVITLHQEENAVILIFMIAEFDPSGIRSVLDEFIPEGFYIADFDVTRARRFRIMICLGHESYLNVIPLEGGRCLIFADDRESQKPCPTVDCRLECLYGHLFQIHGIIDWTDFIKNYTTWHNVLLSFVFDWRREA